MKGFFSVVYDLLFGFLLHITQTKPLWLPIVIMIPFLAFLETLANIILPALLPTLVDIMKKLEKAEGGKVFEVDPAFLKPLIELARKLKFPTERIIPMPLFQNAGVAGVGRYAVMLIGDGLKIFLQLTDAEMLAVVGHELGHWILNHTLYICILNMVLYSCYTAIVIYLMRNKAFYMSFDIETDPQLPIGVGLILITGFFQLFTFFIQPFLNYFRHICEYQADAFSVGLGFGGELLSGMMKLHTGGNALAQPIYGIFLHTHPVYSARVQAIAEKIASIRG
jgi:STE24 endopeptidase